MLVDNPWCNAIHTIQHLYFADLHKQKLWGGQVAQVLYISMPFLSTKQQHQSTDPNHVKSSTDLILS